MGCTRKYSFSRASVAYKQDGTQVAANAPRYEAGQFGQAVMVEEGTTNYVTSPTTQQNLIAPSSGYTQPTWSHTHPYGGAVQASSVTYAVSFDIQINGTKAFSSIVVGGLSGGDGWMYRLLPTGSFTIADLGNGWKRYSIAFTISPSYYLQTYIKFIAESPDYEKVNSVVKNVQLEQKAYATSFIDGTRAAETLTIPASVLNSQQGTIELWVKPGIFSGWTNHFNLNDELNIAEDPYLRISYNGTSVSSGEALSKNNTSYIAVVYGATVKIFINGIKKAEQAAIAKSGNWVGVLGFLGSHISGGYQANDIFDDLRISPIARTDAEILAAYQSNVPLLVDEFTTAKLNFDTFITDWTKYDFYNAEDLNRVESNAQEIVAFMQANFKPPTLTTVTNRDMTRIEFYDDLNRIESNILAIRNTLYEPPGWLVPITNWFSLKSFSYADANRLEADLQALDTMVRNIQNYFQYCGVPTCGQDNTFL